MSKREYPSSIEASKDLRFLVVGTGRSGSRWASGVWTNIGFPCGHEWVFNPWLTCKPHSFVADANHQAAPFLREVKEANPEILIFHQLRNPFDYVASVYGESSFLAPSLHESFMLRHIDMDAEDEVTAAMQVWVKWNDLIAPFSDFTYPVECCDQTTINTCLELLGEESRPVDLDQPRNVHRRMRKLDKSHVRESDYWPEFEEAIARYGY